MNKKTPRKQNPRDYDKAAEEAIKKMLDRRSQIFLEEAVGMALDQLGGSETKKILLSYVELVEEFR